MNIANLPKVELHLHLDGSLSFDLVNTLNPSISLQEFQSTFIAPSKCHDLADYIKRAEKSIALMQTEEQLKLVTFDLFQQLKADHVIYAEIRFAPLLHTLKGLSSEQVVATINEAVENSINQFDIQAGIILCTLRSYTEQQSLETVKLMEQFNNTHILGFDIAGNEAGFPINEHVKAFEFAKRKGIKFTAHAGEAKGPESVWETINNFQPSRIGHGVKSIEDEKLVQYLKEKQIHLEICPTSNIQVDVFEKIEDHPVDKFFNAGISLSINTDDRTISNTTLNKEYQLLKEVFDWNESHFRKCNLEAIKHAFASDTTKKTISEIINNA